MIDLYDRDGVTCAQLDVILGGQRANTVYVFLVDGMLIDTGPKSLEEDMISFYEQYDFDLVTLTHSHEDHSGTAPWILSHLGVPIYVHPNGIDICTQAHPYPAYRQMIWGKRDPFQATALGENIHSRHLEWQVIYTPGHADDHVALFDVATGRLFTGDLFVAPKTKVMMDTESIPVTMNSIRRLLSYDFGPMFCCHAGYIQNGKEMLQQKLDYLENLSGEVNDLHQQGLSAAEITLKLFPKPYPIILVSEGEWDSLHIVTSILAQEE